MTDPRDELTPADDLDLDLQIEASSEPEADIDLGAPASDASADDVQLDLGEDLSLGTDDTEIDLSTDPEDDDETGIDLGLDDDDEDEAEPAATEADSEEADKALAELHERLQGEPGDWYVVHTYSGMENRVRQNLESRVKTLNMEDYIFEAIVPTEQVDELRGNQRKTVTRTVLPGYVLVRMDLTDESWATVRHTPSVTGFVGHAQNPVPISLEDVEKMLAPSVIAAAQAEAKGPKRVKRKAEVVDFAVGDSVQVDDGPFAGMHATITELNIHNQRAKVLVELLGRETPMELTFAQIKKV